METNNFEQQSREKFEERELQPSNAAWGKLEQMLDDAQPQKKKSTVPWLAIAASFVGIAIIATIFFSRNSPEANNFAEQDTTTEILKTEDPLIENVIEKNDRIKEGIANNNNVELKESEIKSETKSNTNSVIRESKVSTANRIKMLADTSVKKPTKVSSENANSQQKPKGAIAMLSKSDNENTISELKNNKMQIEAVLNDGVASNNVTKENTVHRASKEEIDALLNNAQNNVEKQQLLNPSSSKVDAMALLNAVETDVQRSLRSKVLYALGDGIEFVKQNVVNIDD